MVTDTDKRRSDCGCCDGNGNPADCGCAACAGEECAAADCLAPYRNRYYTQTAAAHSLGITRQGVRNLVKRGRIRGLFAEDEYGNERLVAVPQADIKARVARIAARAGNE